jgi:alkanesulfonate monooxygenase SsuD/methylene tetrahydromethanopterin reductase-like flavin-dependent oxidoreductase (luciferase family)
MTHAVNFGLWYDFRNPEPWRRPFESLYQGNLEQIAHAETLGFGSCWLTEHHFCEDGYTPSPLVLAAAIGQRTRNMRIGTNLMILPLHEPVRIAEDAATLSLLTGGRFDLGVGIGYKQAEFEQFGRTLKQRPRLMEQGLDIIRRGWAGDTIERPGATDDLHRVTPRPEHAPRIFIGGMSEPAIDRAARLGDGFLSTGGIGHDLYLAALSRHGKDPAAGIIIAGCPTNISVGGLLVRPARRPSSPTRSKRSRTGSMNFGMSRRR